MKTQPASGKKEVAITILLPWTTFVLTGLLFLLALDSGYLRTLLVSRP